MGKVGKPKVGKVGKRANAQPGKALPKPKPRPREKRTAAQAPAQAQRSVKSRQPPPKCLPPASHRFQPGQSGNPAGRPKGLQEGPRAKLRRLLRKEVPSRIIAILKRRGFQFDSADYAAAICERLLLEGLKGNVKALELIFEQVELPLKQAISIEGAETGPVQIILPPMPPELPPPPAPAPAPEPDADPSLPAPAPAVAQPNPEGGEPQPC